MGRRIGGAGGGSDKGSSSSGTIVVGTVAAIAIASAGGGLGAGVGGTASSSSGTVAESLAGRNMAARKANGKRAASRGNADEAWRRMGLRGVKKTVKQDLECVVNSFGQIREFFLHTPCTSLDRALFAVADEQGDLIIVSVAWVGFRTRGDARRFKELDDVYGTGNISPLGGALLGMADVRLTGQHYQSRRAGTTAVIAEAEPVGGPVAEDVLDGVAEVAVLLPRI
jgi:hypothetical protein